MAYESPCRGVPACRHLAVVPEGWWRGRSSCRIRGLYPRGAGPGALGWADGTGPTPAGAGDDGLSLTGGSDGHIIGHGRCTAFVIDVILWRSIGEDAGPAGRARAGGDWPDMPR